jgi:signal transduction histidine kinase/ligand-binding sensor domain-containing protein
MKKLFLIILLVCFQAFFTPVLAQLKPNNLSFYSDSEGVFINDIITDRQGVVWIATNNGLVRYDGYEYKHYDVDPKDPKTLGSILPYKLYEAQNGHIWIGCTDMLCEYNPDTKTFKNYNIAKLTDFPLGSMLIVLTINEDLGGRIYFGAYNTINYNIGTHSIFYKDKNKEQLQRFEALEKVEIKSVYQATTDKLGNIWILTANGFFRIDNNKNIYKENWPIAEFLTDKYYSTIINDVKGNIWMAASNAVHSILSVWNPNRDKIKSYSLKTAQEKEPLILNEMELDAKGNIWIATNRGLGYFDLKKEQFQLLKESEDPKMAKSEIYCLHLDSFDNVWMGTPSMGLLRYTQKAELKSFVYKKEDKNSITSGWVNKMFEKNDGKVWMATDKGLNVYDPKNNTLTPFLYADILPGFGWCTTIGEFSDEEILIQTNKEHLLFNVNTKTYKKTILDPKLNKLYIFNLKTDSRDNQWYCTAKGAFLKIKNKKTLQHIDLKKLPGSNITSNLVNTIYESSKYGIWLLTDNGLFLYNYATAKVERYGFDQKKGDVLKSQDINSLYIDNEGILWVGTWNGGLHKYNIKTGKIKYYTIKDGLPSMGIQGILPDEKNKALWISTFEGMSRFSITENQFNNFSMEEGIQGRLFADGSCLKTSSGLMLFGGQNGITVFDPNDITKNSTPPKVFITDFKIGDISLFTNNDSLKKNTANKKENIVLKFNQNNISINYIGIHYANPANNKFAYKLENYDNSWREVGTVRTAFYYNLPPGDYTFRVKAANSNGVWNETGASIHFSITPPWWRTWWAYAIYGLLFIVVLFSIDRFQRKRFLEKQRVMAKEIELAQAKEIEKAYHKLKETQSQLIQSEKMASLGELTAGIAHEIQNPLNFINNFSEVSNELIDEMNDEIEKGDFAEAKSIAADIKLNLEKINHHGKRADGIVKGMLQHSRSSNGIKEPTDINKLADEYLRLAYHGLRAKDKSFNATMKTDYDESIGTINIISQDMGRVILNLITNAFYVVDEKKKSPLTPEGGTESVYEPTVLVSTKKVGDTVQVSVKDNGNGIPQRVLDKIFQPFFTTKPTGQGTGLGLSLSYDIVKAHGGELIVETKEGEGAEFIIHLPI